MPPLVSIVTVNLNGRDGLARTLASVERQPFADREVVVVDGGSTDGSVDVIRRSPVVTAWSSEKDRGIYDGMNKGLRRARGTYCVFLNGGDALASDDALGRFFAAGSPVEDILYSDAVRERADGSTDRWETPPRPTLEFLMRSTLPHPCCAIRRDLFERIGAYDTSYRIAADYEFFLRAILGHGASTRHVPVPLAIHCLGGLSTRPDTVAATAEERRRAVEQAVPAALRAEWQARVAASRRGVAHAVREALRPLSRQARALSRRLRGKPDA